VATLSPWISVMPTLYWRSSRLPSGAAAAAACAGRSFRQISPRLVIRLLISQEPL
jgi:hypothetical protein